MRANNYQLQFITHHNDRYSYIDSARIALEGGCRWIQLRMKDASEKLLEETALAVQRMCREHGATFIIDDNVLLTKRIGANGVHLGKNDMPIAEARKILGEGFIIGGTVNTFEDIVNILRTATPDYLVTPWIEYEEEGVTYIVVSPETEGEYMLSINEDGHTLSQMPMPQ